MASFGQFYVLGPPGQHANVVKGLVLHLMRQTQLLTHESRSCFEEGRNGLEDISC